MHLDGTKERKDVLLFGGCIIPTQLGGGEDFICNMFWS